MFVPSVFQRPRFLALHVLFQTACTALYWYGDSVLEHALLEGAEGISVAIPGNQYAARFRASLSTWGWTFVRVLPAILLVHNIAHKLLVVGQKLTLTESFVLIFGTFCRLFTSARMLRWLFTVGIDSMIANLVAADHIHGTSDLWQAMARHGLLLWKISAVLLVVLESFTFFIEVFGVIRAYFKNEEGDNSSPQVHTMYEALLASTETEETIA